MSSNINTSNVLSVVILAGGDNSRFFPLNIDTHKGAFFICGKPIIIKTIENLINVGISHIYIIVSQKDFGGIGLSVEIKKYNLPIRIDFILQKKATGMGNALLLVKNFIKEKRFVVCFPYTIEAGNILKKIILKNISNLVLTLAITDTPWLYGIVSIRKDRVTTVIEKPIRGSEPSNLKIQGLYVLSINFIDILSKTKNHEYNFEEALKKFVENEKVSYIKLRKPLLTLKYPWHLFGFLKFFLGRKNNYIGNNCKIEDGVKVKNSFIGDNTQISKGVKILNSIILNHCNIRSNIKNSIISSYVLVSKNVKLKNKNNAYVYTSVKDKIVNTGLKKFNTVIGNRSIIGKNVSIHAGVFIGSNVKVSNGVNVKKNILHNTTICL